MKTPLKTLLSQASLLTRALVCSLLALSLYSSPTLAQNQGRWYSVEILIFKRQENQVTVDEDWRNTIELAYPANSRYLQNANSGNLSILPPNRLRLGGYKNTLRKKENHKILYHKVWRQRMQGKNSAPSIVINGGDLKGDNKELEGSIKIHIARYLHLTTDLWLTTDGHQASGQTSESFMWPAIPPRPGTVATNSRQAADNTQDNNQAATQANNFDSNLANLNYRAQSNSPITVMRERRKMRSKQVHYIDHPLIGMFILIRPI